MSEILKLMKFFVLGAELFGIFSLLSSAEFLMLVTWYFFNIYLSLAPILVSHLPLFTIAKYLSTSLTLYDLGRVDIELNVDIPQHVDLVELPQEGSVWRQARGAAAEVSGVESKAASLEKVLANVPTYSSSFLYSHF